jgi:hypothetical protein
VQLTDHLPVTRRVILGLPYGFQLGAQGFEADEEGLATALLKNLEVLLIHTVNKSVEQPLFSAPANKTRWGAFSSINLPDRIRDKRSKGALKSVQNPVRIRGNGKRKKIGGFMENWEDGKKFSIFMGIVI